MRFTTVCIIFNLFFFSIAAQNSVLEPELTELSNSVNAQNSLALESFLEESPLLNLKVDSIFGTLDENSIIAQLLMPAVGRMGIAEDSIKTLLKDNLIGGVLLLNGTKEQCMNWVTTFEKMNVVSGNLPFLYSADAEPSLVNNKIKGTTPVAKANEILTLLEVYEVAKTISDDLNEIGINYNFSPVVDLSSNKTVGYRGFGSDPMNVIPFSNAFIEQTQSQNIIATAKHFPGHGLVSGDTHQSLQVIDGELKEIHNYPPLIENGVLSIMVAHIAVKNNAEFDTKGLPSTISNVIVQQLLRDSLNFKGLIVTDAMNMGGIAKVPNANVKAIDAGCDIVLMPIDARLAHKQIKAKYNADINFKKKVEIAAKRIIRMKICLGLIN